MKTELLLKNLFLVGIITLISITAYAQTKVVGGDISMLTKYENAKVSYYDQSGNKISDLLTYFRDEAGYNTARVRLFVNPITKNVGVVQDLDYVIALSKRIKQAGMHLMLDFHYSDTWADPKAQWTPAAWVALSESELAEMIYTYTKDVLTQLVAADAVPDYIQTGNEISYGMLWGAEGSQTYRCYYNNDSNWERFRNLLKQAGKACREICPEAKIIIHTERTNNWTGTKSIYDRLASVDYDIIGLSYYPEWHNNLNTLKNTLENLHTYFPDKPIIIVETGYYNNWYPENATYNFTATWPASPAGQKNFLDDLVAVVKDMDYMQGILYWFPEENPYNNHVYEPWYNHGLFNPNNGKVSDALFSLKALLPAPSGLTNINAEDISDNKIYTIDGRCVEMIDNMPHGIYIQNGKKIIR